MILVDTSVWIDYFNGIVNPATDRLDQALVRGEAAIGDLIFLEIMQGIRSNADYRETKRNLLTLDQYDMLGQGMAEQCASNYRTLRKKGMTVRKTADVIIASFCIEHQIPLLFLDRDFVPFVAHLGLLPVLDRPPSHN